LNKFYRFLTSIKLAVVLFIIITVTIIVASFIPQNQEPVFYLKKYGELVGNIILIFQFNRFFISLIFLSSLVVITMNLAVCMLDRFIGRMKRKAKKRFGPDIIHLGLLLLIISGVYTLLSRQETTVYLTEGEEVEVLENYMLRLNRLEFLTHENGRPRDWISTVDLIKKEKLEKQNFPIEVNRPLEFKNVKIYQSDFSRQLTLELLDANTNPLFMKQGMYFDYSSHTYHFVNIVESKAVIGLYQGEALIGYLAKEPGDFIGPYILSKMIVKDLTGLKVVKDPSIVFILISLLIITSGLGLTYIQKLREEKL
jgi:cytochrome c biogenesis protein